MRKILASLLCALPLVAVTASSSPALAYGPYAHAYVAAQAAKRLGLDATQTSYYVAGAVLADVDKANRLHDMVGSDTLVKLLQGCVGAGPIARAMTHDAKSTLVAKLVAHTDARARALGAGMRNHGSTDRYADKTAASRVGHANSGTEDLAFDVGQARTSIAGAAAALDGVLSSGLLEDATVRGWLAAAAGLADGVVATQMHGYGCFVKGFVHDKAPIVSAALKVLIFAKNTKACIKKNGIMHALRCTPGKVNRVWSDLAAAHTKIVGESIDAALADYKAHVKAPVVPVVVVQPILVNPINMIR